MKILFLGDHGPTNIRSTKEGLVIGEWPPIPPPEFEWDTILIGNTKGFVSYAALKTFGRWGITVGLMGRGGTPFSTFVPWSRNDSPVRLAQMRAALDERRCALIARALIEAKTGKPIPRGLRNVVGIRRYEAEQDQARWEALGVVRRSGFYKTINAKATNPVSAAINYAQGVHAVKVRIAIAKAGLDPAIGFLHVPTVDKDAFVYDCQELNRRLVDREAIAFARENPDAFLRDEDWVYRLKNEAAKRLAFRVCGALSQSVRYEGMNVPIENVLSRELRRFGKWLQSPSPTLRFYSQERKAGPTEGAEPFLPSPRSRSKTIRRRLSSSRFACTQPRVVGSSRRRLSVTQ